jgi:DUF4097 and DUF4098 domain-containing protein YvlB
MATDLAQLARCYRKVEMKRLLIGTSLFLMALGAAAGEKVDKTIEAADDGYVEIQHLGGHAKITGWSKRQVQVKGELSDNTDEFIFERDGNEVVIKVKVKKRRGSWNSWDNDSGDDLEIFVPENSRVSYTSTNANVEVSEISGGADVDTVNGSIEAENLAGRIRLEAVNGDISAKQLSGEVRIETVNGDIRDRSSLSKEGNYDSVNGDIDVVTNATDVKIETVNGDIEVKLDKIDLLNVNTVNGSIDAYMNLAKQGDVRASSVGGSISLYFQADVSARFDLEGHAGGRIVNKLSSDKEQKAKYGPRRWLEFSLNGGDAKVDVSTVSGRIRIDKK